MATFTNHSPTMTMVFQQKQFWNPKPKDRLKEVGEELLEAQMKYKAYTFKEAFPTVYANNENVLSNYY